uniref:Uncharacterized protein n=1 Tax=Anguilla anguilla TaxID=7936 RepID=A0A0E9U744_ANGAN
MLTLLLLSRDDVVSY